MSRLDLESPSTAIFSDDQQYRYVLTRRWGAGHKFLHICGLNPSTADATLNDPTIRREIDFAKRWGYDGLIKTNLFALRTPHPRVMMQHAEPVGEDNDAWIYRAACAAGHFLNVAAWGAHGGYLCRAEQVIPKYSWKCFGLTKAGHPKHPLYLPATTTLIDFK